MKNNDWKDRLNVVYSTNPDFKYITEEEEETDTLEKKQQKLRVDCHRHYRIHRPGRRSERTGQTVENEMWRRRLYQGRRDSDSRRIQATHHRTSESRRIYSDQISQPTEHRGL